VTGLPRSVDVPAWVRSRLFAGGASSAAGDGRTPALDHLPFGSSVQHLTLVLVHDVYQRFTWVDPTTPS